MTSTTSQPRPGATGISRGSIWLRVLMIAVALFCGSAGYGAVTVQPDDDITVTVANTSTQEGLGTLSLATATPRPTVHVDCSPFAIIASRYAMHQSSSGVSLVGICRNNR